MIVNVEKIKVQGNDDDDYHGYNDKTNKSENKDEDKTKTMINRVENDDSYSKNNDTNENKDLNDKN